MVAESVFGIRHGSIDRSTLRTLWTIAHPIASRTTQPNQSTMRGPEASSVNARTLHQVNRSITATLAPSLTPANPLTWPDA